MNNRKNKMNLNEKDHAKEKIIAKGLKVAVTAVAFVGVKFVLPALKKLVLPHGTPLKI